ncbi:MAG: PIN domain-containing protein [Acetobacteraceae bacterium]
MNYVFDTSPFSTLFKNYYRRTFRSLWERFDELVEDGRIVSTREVLRELEDGPVESAAVWASQHSGLFAMPGAAEGAFVGRIYRVTHFQQNIEQRKVLRGGRCADPFVIARAAVETRAVVTVEEFKPNAVKIPNICRHFDIQCLSLEDFMEAEGWEF